MPRFRKLTAYRTAEALAERAAALGAALPLDGNPAATLAAPWSFEDGSRGRVEIGNRFTILPMEGWDSEADGAPSGHLRRRWLRFADSGAKLLWFEASAVREDGRANPRQLLARKPQLNGLKGLLAEVVERHRWRFGAGGLLCGLQLTHSGRWSRPRGAAAPRIVYRHPQLDARAGLDDSDNDGVAALLADADIEHLIEDYIEAAVCARDAGFGFVDIKHCHGYFAHELLSAYRRPGRYGGALENRMRFLHEVLRGVRERCPELAVAVRFSAYDFRPFRAGADGVGEPEGEGDYRYGFGADASGLRPDWAEIEAFVDRLQSFGIGLVCVTAGSPYYNPHIQRPAFYPPSDGYQPPEDPLLGAARLLDASRRIKRRFPGLGVVGTGFSYLQQHLPAVAAGCVARHWLDSPGLGRASLSCPQLPAEVLAGREPSRRRLCRTFSDCTTAPRNGLRSGCYPLDDFYRDSEDYRRLQQIKRG